MQIVYYSLHGTNEKIARQLAAELNLPLHRIEDVSSRRGFFNFMRSGYESTFRRCPPIKAMADFQPDREPVILLAPVWAGKICSPLRTFCTNYAGRFSAFSLVLTRSDPENKYEAMKDEVARLLGAECQFFESYCAKSVTPADIEALSARLKSAGI